MRLRLVMALMNTMGRVARGGSLVKPYNKLWVPTRQNRPPSRSDIMAPQGVARTPFFTKAQNHPSADELGLGSGRFLPKTTEGQREAAQQTVGEQPASPHG